MNPVQSPSYLSALQEMKRVIFALILREIKARFGNQRLGYLWAFLEPMLFIGIFLVVYSFRGGFKGPKNMGLELFLVTGIVPFLIFRHVMSGSIKALKNNRELLTYPQVQLNDISLASFLLELSTGIVVFCILLLCVQLFNMDNVSIKFPLGVLAGLILMALYGLGLGSCLSALYPIFPSTQPISEALLGRPLFFTSGLFFTADMVPDSFRRVLLWNPLFNTTEYIRSSFFFGVDSPHYSFTYMISFLVILLFLGLLMQRALHRYIMSLP